MISSSVDRRAGAAARRWRARPRPTSRDGMPITATWATAGMRCDRVLDLDRVHVLAAGDDHVLHPVDEEQVAVARRGSRRRRSGTSRRGTPRRSPRACFQYSRMKLPAAGAHLAGLARRQDVAVVVLDRQRRRPAAAGRPTAAASPPARCSSGPSAVSTADALGHAVALVHVEVREQREQPVEQRGRHRRRAVGERAAARRAARAGTRDGSSIMPIIVGTITVVRDRVLLDQRRAPRAGSNSGTNDRRRRRARARRACRPSTRRGTSASGAGTRRRR